MTLSSLPSHSLFLAGGEYPAHRVVSDLADAPRQYELTHIELANINNSVATMLRYGYKPALILDLRGEVVRGHKLMAILRAVYADGTVAYDHAQDDLVRLDPDNPNHINTAMLMGNGLDVQRLIKGLNGSAYEATMRAKDVLLGLTVMISRVDRGHASARELAALFKSLED